jgi:adenosylcobinamide-GDP ribazoletransferase
MRGLIAAIQFITAVPIGKPQEFSPQRMLPFFPLVGLLIGILVALLDRVFLLLWPGPVAALLDVFILIGVTGAFHLDGLGDTADGLYGHRSRESALAIMKDSRIGVMGLVAIVCCLAAKWAGIAGLHDQRSLLLVIIPAYARASILFGMRLLPYGRGTDGTGNPFFDRKIRISGFWGLLIPVALSILLGWQTLVLNLGFIILVLIILLYYKKKISCITGDMLGAMTEITEAGLFLVLSTGIIS